MLALLLIYFELHGILELDRTSEISQFDHLIYGWGGWGVVFSDLPKVKSLGGNKLQVPKFTVQYHFHSTLGNFHNIRRTVCKTKDISANAVFFKKTFHLFVCWFIYLFTYSFLVFREGKGRRKRGRETSICGSATQACDPLVRCPALSPLSHTSQGMFLFIY